jgi:hypothetical protein
VASTSLLVAATRLPWLRRFLALSPPGTSGWLLVAASAIAAVATGRALTSGAGIPEGA